MSAQFDSRLRQVRWLALAVGILGIGACFAGWLLGNRTFFSAYLFGYLFWLGLALGCLEVLMLHYLTGGRWGYPVRRFLEAGTRTIPWMALLFIPLVFGLRELYPWARPEEVAHNEVLQQKHLYMNPTGFILRTAIFFLIWIVTVHFLRKWSWQQDQTPAPEPTIRLRTLSGPGIVLYPVTATFVYIDWIMSLEADWYSTIFPVIILIGQILTTIAFAILVLAFFQKETSISEVTTVKPLHHLGNLMLAFVMFWTYVSFSQWLIIWSGNLPHEIEWYVHRSSGAWKWIVIFLALFHFFIPFFILLFRTAKMSLRPLSLLAVMVFSAHVVNVYWLVTPSFEKRGIHLHWMHFAAPIGVGGLWIALFLWQLKKAPLLPQQDPGLQFSVLHEHAH
ncbi:MAG: hypothetical protein JWM16_4025 [Verrucomicrobiales bacterium]|nr:hypothetical protein [Verrucomicrobiales bacterium]